MSETTEYVPPKVWTWDKELGERIANINRPIAGATHEKVLPVGKTRSSSTRWARRTA